MDGSRSSRLETALRGAALLSAAACAAAFLVLATARIAYPYDLDFIEDGILLHALRLAQNQPVWLPPNAAFVPHVYMPLFATLGGLLFKVTGPGFAPLRLLSLAATLVSALLIFGIARREGGSPLLAAVCSGLFLAGYRIAGGVYDLARVDPLFVALTLGGVATAVYAHRSLPGLIAAALLLALATLAKQNGLYYAVLTGLYLALAVRWRVAFYALAYAFLAGLPILLLHATTGGWFATYMFGIAFASPLEPQRALAALVIDQGGDMGALLAIWLVVAGAALFRRDWRRLTANPWPFFIAAGVAASVLGRTSVGGSRNQLMQACAFLCLSPALLARELAGWSCGWQRRAARLLWLAILLQFALTLANPLHLLLGLDWRGSFWPSRAMRDSGDRLVARLAEAPGPVWVMMHPYYARQAGKAPAVQVQALWHARWRGRDPLPPDLVHLIQSGAYALIVSGESPIFETEPALQALIARTYVAEDAGLGPLGPPTLNGLVVQPQVVYVRR